MNGGGDKNRNKILGKSHAPEMLRKAVAKERTPSPVPTTNLIISAVLEDLKTLV